MIYFEEKYFYKNAPNGVSRGAFATPFRKLQRQQREKLNNKVAIAEVKVKQKAHRESAFSNLARYGPEFVDIAKYFCRNSTEPAEARKEVPKMPKGSGMN